MRQRYEYYGYILANYSYDFGISSTNTRHVLNGREPSVTLENDGGTFTVLKDGMKIGMIRSGALTLDDYTFTADAFEMFFRETGSSSMNVRVRFHELPLANALSELAENVTVSQMCQILIFNFKRCLLAGLKARAQAGLCADGELTVKVGDEIFGLRVTGNNAEAFDSDVFEYEFTPVELQRLALSLTEHVTDRRVPNGWLPISLPQ